jgi:hypothetical protein
MVNGHPKRELGKSKFSMYLRTKCDRELYLSLFSNNPDALSAAGVPVPLKSRPGVELITNSGKEFEHEQYDALINALPGYVLHEKNGRGYVVLKAALHTVKSPTFILQPQIEPETFRDVAFKRLGVPDGIKACIPPLAGLRPDVLYVGTPGTAKFEVLPNAGRLEVGELIDERLRSGSTAHRDRADIRQRPIFAGGTWTCTW